jgi:predicted nucleotidyltransferase
MAAGVMLTAALDAFVERLKPVPGIVALVVGGSRARGWADTSSDTDLGLYYHRHNPLNVAALDAVATECDDRKSAGLVTASFGQSAGFCKSCSL